MRGIESGTPLFATATSATSAVATLTGVAGQTIYGVTITGSSDKAGALALVKDGTTVIWQDRISNTAAYWLEFQLPIKATVGASLSVTVDGTAMCNANISGYII